ncbi:hypothetical protein [Jannaschia seohaensis]|uniref:Uncharacterized protein n=1 Tax=Jannaschia seohaensis TaxID=475081 RepID=A0A2Y9A2Y5_9RHOB|nr:hypothetical protein [Jannaschia seohaensis]PWJ21978.1 hypothetical protein BCF38_101387 [Jannaschia seohaensis]SSA38256.1 hypothetical protein SAMN05421539_101387 [Jannaschia seohaensis]
MEALAALWARVTEGWAGLPSLPPLGLPAPPDPDLLIVIATSLMALGLTAALSARIDGRRSWAGRFAVILSAGMFFWVWEAARSGFGWTTIPAAFVEVAARILR